jgi:hypothetical protein
MSLDLSSVVKQISEMVARLKAGREERLGKISRAVEVLHRQAENLEKLQRKIALSQTTWLVAEPVERFDRRYLAPATPAEFTILATDGSHIDVDRHHSTHCYLINISTVVLRYGSNPDAILESTPRVYSSDEDLMIPSPDRLREVPIEGNLLGIKRSVEECRKLSELAGQLPKGSTSLALMDGTLILWNLEAYPEFITEILLDKGYLVHFEEMRRLSQDRHLAVAGYISFPRSTDVVNALRVALCPRELVDSDHCSACESRQCYGLAGVRDRELFSRLLEPGERSALFISPSKIQKRYGRHLVHFFYLRVDGEIARVEIPHWVAKDEDRLNLAHTLVLDQCRRGLGYPVALSEAHEKAVVTGTDRESFWQMVDSTLTEEHLPMADSAKSQSKRTRWI